MDEQARVTEVTCLRGNRAEIHWDDGAVATKPMPCDPCEEDGFYLELYPNHPETFGPHTPKDYFRSPLEVN